MTGRRAYAVALVALAVGGVVLAVAYGLTWARIDVPLLAGGAADGLAGGAAGVGSRQVALSGAEVLPLAAAGGWVGVAAVGGVLATRGVGRVVVAVLAVLAALGGALGGIVFAVRAAQIVGALHPSATAVQVTAGWAVAIVGGTIAAAAAVWVVVRGRGWPTMGARYERRPAAAATLSDWQRQDLGLDPTDDRGLVE